VQQQLKTLFLTPGCFDKGGVSRYSRYQIDALERIVGPDSLRTMSLLGPTCDSFEGFVKVDWAANGSGLRHKAAFALHALREASTWRPRVIHSAHVHLSGLALAAAHLCGARTVLNTYGLEVWSGMHADAAFGLKHTDHVLSDCHATAEYLEHERLRPRGTVEVMWDCVDLTRFFPRPASPDCLRRYKLPDPSQHFVLLTLGRISHDAAHKGYERLIDVFARLSPRHSSLRLVVAGEGDLRAALQRDVAARGLSGQVVFPGSISDDDLPDVYRAATLFALITDRGPHRGEGIPLTPLEAMACGVPILVGNQDGSREAVVERRNGLVLDPFALESHTEMIELLIRDPELRGRLSNGATEVARERFSFEAFLQKHRQLYRRL
jgi:phosphatidylinositol alpha-1,6-mannosyltransferase